MVDRRTMLGSLVALACSTGPAAALPRPRPKPHGRRVFLTSDDGPGEGTDAIIDMAERLEVPVTLFMIGGNAAGGRGRALLERAKASPWIAVGNHSYSHSLGRYAASYHKTDWTVADFERANEALGLAGEAVIARAPGRNVWRLPGLSRDDGGLSHKERQAEDATDDALYAAGFHLYGWDVEWPHDGRGVALYSPVQMIDLIASPALRPREDGAVVVLMHDIMMRSRHGALALSAIVEGLLARGHTIERLTGYATSEV